MLPPRFIFTPPPPRALRERARRPLTSARPRQIKRRAGLMLSRRRMDNLDLTRPVSVAFIRSRKHYTICKFSADKLEAFGQTEGGTEGNSTWSSSSAAKWAMTTARTT